MTHYRGERSEGRAFRKNLEQKLGETAERVIGVLYGIIAIGANEAYHGEVNLSGRIPMFRAAANALVEMPHSARSANVKPSMFRFVVPYTTDHAALVFDQSHTMVVTNLMFRELGSYNPNVNRGSRVALDMTLQELEREWPSLVTQFQEWVLAAGGRRGPSPHTQRVYSRVLEEEIQREGRYRYILGELSLNAQPIMKDKYG